MLHDHGLLGEQECEELVEGARFIRTVEHVVRLVTSRTRKWLPVADHPRRAVQKLIWKTLGGSDNFDPEIRLTEVMRKTRNVYLRFFGG